MRTNPRNRRLFPREPGDACATVSRASDASGREIRGYLLDMSARGIALLLRERLDAGEVVAINLRKPSTHVKIQLSGSVRYVSPLGDGTFRVGIALKCGLAPAGLQDLRRAFRETWRPKAM